MHIKCNTVKISISTLQGVCCYRSFTFTLYEKCKNFKFRIHDLYIFPAPVTGCFVPYLKGGCVRSRNVVMLLLMHCSDPASILGGVRLPPDTEIIKYTSSIVGPKIPGTTNRGRKKTISLDPPSVSVMAAHSSTGLLIERGGRRFPRSRVS